MALYPVYCLINHACFNNTNYVKFPDLRLELRAQLPIRKGEEIFTRYISSTIGEYELILLNELCLEKSQFQLDRNNDQAMCGGAPTSRSIGSSTARARAARTPPSWAPSCPPSAATPAGPATSSRKIPSTPGFHKWSERAWPNRILLVL